MFSNDDGGCNSNVLPFSNSEIATDVRFDRLTFQKSQHNIQHRKRHKSAHRQTNYATNNNRVEAKSRFSYIYFENMEPDNNRVTFIPYTGPCNTAHLATHLYIPQLVPNATNDLKMDLQRFTENYEKFIEPLNDSLTSSSLSIFLRFGISYLMNLHDLDGQQLPLKDFIMIRNRGKKFRSSFYTCKGVTSPKHLLTEINKLNYHQVSSNTYTYDIQLYGGKNHQERIIHFRFDERLQCYSIHYRPEHPLNFDFIRNKAVSSFRSVDDSYYDIFDFRIQVSQANQLSRTDPLVVDVLRGVPVDQILYLDKSTQILHVSSRLQKFVKYLKCTRSSNYYNAEEQIFINIGVYEEFRLNSRGQCESLMKASNTMTIELLDLKYIPPAKKLYDLGVWFSILCQSCVDLPSTGTKNDRTKSLRWFSGISIWRKKSNQSVKHMNLNELTTYKVQKSTKHYSTVELALVKKILQEDNLRHILLTNDAEKSHNKKSLEEKFENIMKRLETSAAPSANEAMEKVRRAYWLLCEELKEP